MARYNFFLCYWISLSLISSTNLISCIIEDNREVYVVYMGSTTKEKGSKLLDHVSMLKDIMRESNVANSLIRSYRRSFNGFAAKLTEDEAKRLADKEDVVSVFPSTIFQLHTTRSWDFLGLGNATDTPLAHGNDTIIGVIDTGILPESDSFSDHGYTSPPKKWKGSCDGGANFTCNNKIIGARRYSFYTARDEVGHGSHTASTAAGNKVSNTSFYGIAEGTARGGLPLGRIAVYKACGERDCRTEDILAAFDDAIADGVDIITISIGSRFAIQLFTDPIAIGAFHAMEKGILTVQSAGNSGPNIGLISSVAPWLLSVAASSTDRRIIDKATLGNGNTVVGNAINGFSLNKTMFPLATCEKNLVKGKILLCGTVSEAWRRGAIGVIASGRNDDNSKVQPMPAIVLNSSDYEAVKSYVASSKSPIGIIQKSETTKDYDAPVVAYFSSRGPNRIIPDILKPDVSAPGVDILAAYVPTMPPTSLYPEDQRRVKYNFLSGTSMSCPHVAGAAAYIKTIHPEWSPAAIKSAIMTTASLMDSTKSDLREFAYGSGHLNPMKAINPGLIYELHKDDYINFLCAIGLSEDNIRAIVGDNSTCPKGNTKILPRDLNSPSLAAKVVDNKTFKLEFHRRVTNVGFKNSTFKAKILGDFALKIDVAPKVLSFDSLLQERSFVVTVIGEKFPNYNKFLTASLEWSDGTHNVRSPIVIYNM